MTEVENAMGDGTSRARLVKPLQSAREVLDPLVASLEIKLGIAAERTAVDAVNPELLERKCKELIGLLLECNVNAESVFVANAGLFKAAFGTSYDRLKTAIDDLDFDSALAVLDAARTDHHWETKPCADSGQLAELASVPCH